jgi:DNA-binding transcriptional LysR family regulator
MQLKWIDDLLAVAETKSFSRAADLRCITQSALSRRVRSLEEWVGVELVNRGTYPVQLTTAGRTFCDQGREALATLLELRATLRQESRMPGQSLSVTAGHTLSMTFLPKWLKQFQVRNGAFNARVVAANVHQAVIALAEGGCDLTIAYHHPQAAVLLDSDKFASLTLGQDAFVPICAPDAQGRPLYRLPGTAKAPIPHLAYTDATFLGRVVDAILAAAPQPYHLSARYEADMAVLLMQMAKEGYGVAWLPLSAVAEELAQGRLVEAGGAAWTTTLDIRFYRALANANPALGRFWSALESERDLSAATGAASEA